MQRWAATCLFIDKATTYYSPKGIILTTLPSLFVMSSGKIPIRNYQEEVHDTIIIKPEPMHVFLLLTATTSLNRKLYQQAMLL